MEGGHTKVTDRGAGWIRFASLWELVTYGRFADWPYIVDVVWASRTSKLRHYRLQNVVCAGISCEANGLIHHCQFIYTLLYCIIAG